MMENTHYIIYERVWFKRQYADKKEAETLHSIVYWWVLRVKVKVKGTP